MILADYCLPGADASFVEPFASRLLRLLEFFQGRVMIESGYRSTEQQQALYDAYLAGTGNLAAKPGFSEHEFGRAADLDRFDQSLSWGEVHYTAAAYGLKFPIPSELWHCEATPNWVDPDPHQPPEDDMTKEEFAAAIGATIPTEGPFAGLVCVELADTPTTGSLYPLASAVSYIHKEGKYPSAG